MRRLSGDCSKTEKVAERKADFSYFRQETELVKCLLKSLFEVLCCIVLFPYWQLSASLPAADVYFIFERVRARIQCAVL